MTKVECWKQHLSSFSFIFRNLRWSDQTIWKLNVFGSKNGNCCFGDFVGQKKRQFWTLLRIAKAFSFLIKSLLWLVQIETDCLNSLRLKLHFRNRREKNLKGYSNLTITISVGSKCFQQFGPKTLKVPYTYFKALVVLNRLLILFGGLNDFNI